MSVRDGEVVAGKYRVDRLLGSGGMGLVVAATHLHLHERVALKLMHAESLGHADSVARFMREARAAVKLKSEHVARVLDIGVLDSSASGAPYIVIEYLEGLDLSQYLKARGPLSIEQTADFVLQACDAIAEAHSIGIVHRDLKPANLFLTRRPDGTPFVKVLDFGISKANPLLEPGGVQTKTSTMMGSPVYSSPEQMQSARDVDARADIWSLGILMFELVSGRVPFRAHGLGALLTMVRNDAPPPLRALNPAVPPTFEAIILRCLEKDRAARFASVAELARAIVPYAPARERHLADRIEAMLGHNAPPALPVSPLAATAYAGPMSSSGMPLSSAGSSSAGPTTGSPWAQSHATRGDGVRRSVAGPIAVVAVWLVVGVACAVGYAVFRKAHAPSVAAGPSSAVDLPAIRDSGADARD